MINCFDDGATYEILVSVLCTEVGLKILPDVYLIFGTHKKVLYT